MITKSEIYLAWGGKVSFEFAAKVIDICRLFDWTEEYANWLMACMAFESAETFRSDIKNAAGSGACGLIQFMPSTLKGLGYTVKDAEKMTPEEQLDLVCFYFKPYHARIHSLSDMYMAILLPKYVGKPENSVLFSRGIAYRQNSGLDENKDGKITKKEAASKVAWKLRKGLRPKYAKIIKL